jgi:hypothetical protein
MADQMHDQVLEVMLPATGEWVTLHTWSCEGAVFDADGWLDKWAERIGSGQAPLPGGGRVDLSAFCAIRNGN